MLNNEKFTFFLKVVAAHVVTYMVVGMASFSLLYANFDLTVMGFKPMSEINLAAILTGQIIRGFLLGAVIWWIKDSIVGKKMGWLKLWGILVILGIFNTYGPAMGSVEGFIYLDMSRYENLPPIMSLSVLEILVQPLLFSLAVFFINPLCAFRRRPA